MPFRLRNAKKMETNSPKLMNKMTHIGGMKNFCDNFVTEKKKNINKSEQNKLKVQCNFNAMLNPST